MRTWMFAPALLVICSTVMVQNKQPAVRDVLDGRPANAQTVAYLQDRELPELPPSPNSTKTRQPEPPVETKSETDTAPVPQQEAPASEPRKEQEAVENPAPANSPVTEGVSEKPPVAEPPVAEPPVAEPPVAEPPVAEPPVAEPPVAEPPVAEPPVAEPPVAEPPVAEPPVAEPPATVTPVTEPELVKPATEAVQQVGADTVDETAVETAHSETTEPVDDGLPVINPGPSTGKSYRAIYESIPFSRAEYEANPSYRHDATMEILFGKQRPMTIHRYQQMPERDNRQYPELNPGRTRLRFGLYYAPNYPGRRYYRW